MKSSDEWVKIWNKETIAGTLSVKIFIERVQNDALGILTKEEIDKQRDSLKNYKF